MPKKGGGKRTSDIAVDQNASASLLPEAEGSQGFAGALPKDFKSLLLQDNVLRGLEQAGYDKPSPIQARAIPLGKFGADLVIQAKSGTGKTCVFAVILLESISLDYRSPQAMIIAPTRELAHQTRDVIQSIGQYMAGLGCQAFVGGMSTDVDVKALSLETAACHIVSGTPGRLRALIEMGALRLEGVRHLVLDEVDQLLAEGFRPQVEYFLAVLPTRRQMLAVSATFTPDLLDYLNTIMHKPQMVSVVKDSVVLKGVRQFFLDVQPPGAKGKASGHDKLKNRMHGLVQVLETTNFHQCVVFTNSRILGQRVAQLLEQLGFPAQFVCGDMPQEERLSAISRLRDFELRVLVSSDLTARGINVERINLVVNLELPASYDTYLHRVGRTGRFGRYGVAVTIVEGEQERQKVQDMGNELLVDIQPKPEVISPELLSMEDVEEEEEEVRRFQELTLKRDQMVQQQTDSSALIDKLAPDKKGGGGAGGGSKDKGAGAPKGVAARGEKAVSGLHVKHWQGKGGQGQAPALDSGEGSQAGAELGQRGARIGGEDVSAGGGRDLGWLRRGSRVLVRIWMEGVAHGNGGGGLVKMCEGCILGGGSAPGLFWVELDVLGGQDGEAGCRDGGEWRRTEVDVEDIWRLEQGADVTGGVCAGEVWGNAYAPPIAHWVEETAGAGGRFAAAQTRQIPFRPSTSVAPGSDCPHPQHHPHKNHPYQHSRHPPPSHRNLSHDLPPEPSSPPAWFIAYLQEHGEIPPLLPPAHTHTTAQHGHIRPRSGQRHPNATALPRHMMDILGRYAPLQYAGPWYPGHRERR